MKIIISLNANFGFGYSVRVLHPPVSELVNDQAYTLNGAVDAAQTLLEVANEILNKRFALRKVLRIDNDAILANREYDALSAHLAAKLDAGQRNAILVHPNMIPSDNDAELPRQISERGAVIGHCVLWHEKRQREDKGILEGFCQLVAERTGGNAKKLVREFARLPYEEAAPMLDLEKLGAILQKLQGNMKLLIRYWRRFSYRKSFSRNCQ